MQLQPVETPPPKTVAPKTRAFIRMASERCRAIVLALPDSGKLSYSDIMSMTTFWALNQCVVPKLELQPYAIKSEIKSVRGYVLKVAGRIKGGLNVQLQGSAGQLFLNPLVSYNFSGAHLILSLNSMAKLKLQLQPNLEDGHQFIKQSGSAPLVPRGGLYSLNYTEPVFKRISIFRFKTGFLKNNQKWSAK